MEAGAEPAAQPRRSTAQEHVPSPEEERLRTLDSLFSFYDTPDGVVAGLLDTAVGGRFREEVRFSPHRAGEARVAGALRGGAAGGRARGSLAAARLARA